MNKEGRKFMVDSHCHLDFPVFADDLAEVIERASEAGVQRMLTICTSLGEFETVAAIAERFPSVFFAAGTHPHKVGEDPLISIDQLIKLSAHPKMVGIGETGLDYHYTRELEERQKQSLTIHIAAARQTGLPLIIHSREADQDMAEILNQEYAKGKFHCVMHCFSSGPELARAASRLGFYLSISGIATFRNAESLRTVIAQTPIDQVLIETDSPYLAPEPYRGKRNEPAYVAKMAEVGAQIFGLSRDEFAARTTANFDRLFSKAKIDHWPS